MSKNYSPIPGLPDFTKKSVIYYWRTFRIVADNHNLKLYTLMQLIAYDTLMQQIDKKYIISRDAKRLTGLSQYWHKTNNLILKDLKLIRQLNKVESKGTGEYKKFEITPEGYAILQDLEMTYNSLINNINE